MSESVENYDDESTESLDPNIRAELRKSKERAKEIEVAKSELESLKRDLAFTKAGIPEKGVGILLRKAYDGEIDPDAIREAAREYNIFPAEQQSNVPDPIVGELERHRNIAGATGTGTSGPTGAQSLIAAMGEATNEHELMKVIEDLGFEQGLRIPGIH